MKKAKDIEMNEFQMISFFFIELFLFSSFPSFFSFFFVFFFVDMIQAKGDDSQCVIPLGKVHSLSSIDHFSMQNVFVSNLAQKEENSSGVPELPCFTFQIVTFTD